MEPIFPELINYASSWEGRHLGIILATLSHIGMRTVRNGADRCTQGAYYGAGFTTWKVESLVTLSSISISLSSLFFQGDETTHLETHKGPGALTQSRDGLMCGSTNPGAGRGPAHESPPETSSKRATWSWQKRKGPTSRSQSPARCTRRRANKPSCKKGGLFRAPLIFFFLSA